ncbi:hypothetical protein RSOLAG1IB_03886 [Rhizoctonia solani AG-1 IB]|uniref:Uncharacterized protein n=1 Tax=Thanatephorus cucumeris (strain AG1-IB / isolate 7/3/14) TaxID=1108050 RepID=A0A0B7FWP9_THACB|nr:hypothetical protein RSOLAG1IB_03886 [Rhizoctonia solani AG-1 IB]
MGVSKYFFCSAGPVVWRRVPRLDIIMSLVKNVEVKGEKSCADDKWQFIIVLPRNPDFSRYDLYAPWVQELELYCECYVEITNFEKWPSFFNGRIPLPNLRQLTASVNVPVGGNNLIDFFHAFVCPSLTKLRTVIPNQGLSADLCLRVVSPEVPALLQKIEATCPQIEVLEFYPDGMVRFGQLLEAERYAPTSQCKRILSSFSSLRSFSSTTYILKPEILGILGGLPCLESLGIRSTTTEPSVLYKQLSIPETWFPALKDIRLYQVSPDDVKALWNQPAVAKKLTSALLQIDHLNQRHPRTSPLYAENWVGPFLEALPELSPQLQDVSLRTRYLDEMLEVPRNRWDIFKLEHDLDHIFCAYKYGLA